MYTVSQFAHMLQDRPRVDAYTESMRRSIRPGDVVVDIGCGTGYFSLLACQLGARKVYAIEPSDAVELARECVRASGLTDRIECIRDLSTRVTLPGPAQVIVSDLRGGLPLHGRHLPALLDARERLLAPDGILICQRDTIMAAPISHPEGYERCVGIWSSLPGIDQSACHDVVIHERQSVFLADDMKLGPASAWATIDYRHHRSPDVSGTVTWTIDEPLLAHGLCLWFDAEYAGGITYSAGPSHPATPTYNRQFLPWPREVSLAAGDRISMDLDARLFNDEYVWTWSTTISTGSDAASAQFSQCSLLGQPLSKGRLARRSIAFAPTLDDEGAIMLYALSRMDGTASHAHMANDLASRYPHRFDSAGDALNYVTGLSLRFAR